MDHMVERHVSFASKFGYKVTEKEKSLPFMYWTPKCHKSPIGHRFIVASSNCSTKQLANDVSKAFRLVFNQVRNFHEKSHFYSNFNQFWVVENSTPILEKLKRCNLKRNAKSIDTFDFATLYTKIPHDKLVDTLIKVIDFTFKGGKKKFIATATRTAFWTNKSSLGISKKDLKSIVEYLITECHFTVGNIVFTQDIGIPMGISPAPFFANLFLQHYESIFMKTLMKNNVVEARKFHGTYRFIDDLFTLNNNNVFGKSHRDIYPAELELKLEHSGTHATFLDLDISVENKMFVYKLFDKRDAFPFSIVRMPHFSSNIPSFIFYGAFKAEVLRVAKNTMRYCDFIPPLKALLQRMINQGGLRKALIRTIGNVFHKHMHHFASFEIHFMDLVRDLE